MFDMNDLAVLDSEYFTILCMDAYDVTVMSKNTGHYWNFHNPESNAGNMYRFPPTHGISAVSPAWAGIEPAADGKENSES